MKQRRQLPIRGRGVAAFCPCGSGRPLPQCCGGAELARQMANAVTAHQANRIDAAFAGYCAILEIHPRHADALHYSGLIAFQRGDLEQARTRIVQAIALRPDVAAYHANLGNVLKRLGDPGAAQESFARSLALDPVQPAIHYNYGLLLLDLGRSKEAVDAFRLALKRRPDWPLAWLELGSALLAEEAIDAAAAAFANALKLDPRLASAHLRLGTPLMRFGDIAGAILGFEKAEEMDPDDEAPCAARLFALGLSTEHDGAAILAEHQRWQRRFGDSIPRMPSIVRVRGDRLRIAYLSGDLRRHPMRFFVRPMLRHHDRRHVVVTTYATASHTDDGFTHELRPLADEWVDCRGMSPAVLAQRIAGDGIDVLVDLAGHTEGGRMLALAAHPARFQCTMLGYMSTTGARSIDARIADAVAIPPDAETWFSEKILRLPHSQWCYVPDAMTPPVNELPASRNRYLTYGSFHSVAKINARVLALWVELLRSQPTARLLLVAWGEAAKRHLRAPFERAGLGSRLMVVDTLPYDRYLELYHRIDVSLDVFPYAGGTVNCESLWMGVPVMTLAHDSPAGRGGASIMSAAGMPEWVAQNESEWLDRVAELVADLGALAAVRLELRGRLRTSPLMDAPRYAADLECLLAAQVS
jgi:predicted O-linked N-acetylglucosamine transferase (SPINDLY family)